MRYLKYLCIFFIVVQFVIIGTMITTSSAAQPQKQQQTKGQNNRLLERIDFGNAYILGQTIKSGAVYLLQRKKSDIKSMLESRKDYRKEILEDFHIQDQEVKKEEVKK